MAALADFAFAVRSRLTWSPPAFKRLASRAQVEDTLTSEGRRRLRELERRYDLATWSSCCSLLEWRESLYALDVVDRFVPKELPTGRGLDVGAKNGATLPGLATAQPRGWDAVELDAHRRYAWGSTRRVYGEALAHHFADCRFVSGSVTDLQGPWALVTWFLPFLTQEPLEAWGLPQRYLEPERLLRHVLANVLPGGQVLILNQGDDEAALQRDLLSRVGAHWHDLGPVNVPTSPYRLERFGVMATP